MTLGPFGTNMSGGWVANFNVPGVTPELPGFLDAVLADEPFAGGLEPMIGEAHLRTLSILGFPASPLPGILDELNRQGFAYRWATRYIAMDKPAAEKVLGKKRRHWFAKRKSIGAVLRETMFNEQAALAAARDYPPEPRQPAPAPRG